ncbi:MAG: gliding motility-associated C-terminal domain-containing protein [Bacteroidales bacterium]|nr:gliding motility-associated C-terminal domain-containing protein [Bacteroidales bacterium]
MKRPVYLLLCFFALAGFVAKVPAQCPSGSTQGRDFWLMFLQNGIDLLVEVDGEWQPMTWDFSLIAAAEPGTTVVVENPRTGWDTTVTITSSGEAVIPVPNYGYTLGRYATNQGLHVTATNDIALYASNYAMHSYDIATILPTEVLDTTYMAQTYQSGVSSGFQRFNGAQIGFVATEDSTILTMTMICDRGIYYGPAGTVITQTLQRGQTFTLQALSLQSFSGMRVTSNGKPFAMFQGGTCLNVPFDNGTCDHLYEQTVPSRFWGRRFVVVPTAPRLQGDKVLVTMSDYGFVKLDDEEAIVLNEGETYEFEISSSSAHIIETSQPAYVCLYMKGGFDYGYAVYDTMSLTHFGDPSAVTIPPVEQGVYSTRFHAFSTDVSWLHYVNIAVLTEDTSYMMLDGQPIGVAFSPMIRRIGWSADHTSVDTIYYEYSYAQLEVSPGSHILSNSHGQFVAHFYGLGDAETYAYIAGMATRDLTRHLFVNDVDVTFNPGTVTACLGDTALFRFEGASEIENIEWLVDNDQVHYGDTLFQYAFTQTGRYRVDAVLGDVCDTMTAFVNVRFSTDTIIATICHGSVYRFGNRDLDSAGVYTLTSHDHFGCDSLTVLELSVVDFPYYEVFDTFCPNTAYWWHGKQYYGSGDYVDTLYGVNGCDTVATLHLTAAQQPEVSISVIGGCDEYRLSVEGDGMYLLWSSVPVDPDLDGQRSNRIIVVSPMEPTQYTVTVAHDSTYDCPSETSLLLTPPHGTTAQMQVIPPMVTTEHPAFDAFDLSEGATERRWYVDGELVGTEQHLHYLVTSDKDSVILMLVSGYGICLDTAIVVIPVMRISLWVPNTFTPDEETNRLFAPVGEGIISGELFVYNRQGLLVCHKNDYRDGWDGTYRGITCKQDSYVWHLIYRTADAPQIDRRASGTVTLLR